MSKSPTISAPSSQTLDLSTLPIPSLSSVKKQLDEELEQLTASFQKLRSAQQKFRECIKAINDGILQNNGVQDQGKTILVPLTQSLYVPGKLASTEVVLVDVGTGYYVEKTLTNAITFYDKRIKSVGGNMEDLEKIIMRKSQNVKTVEEVLRQKMLSANSSTTGS